MQDDEQVTRMDDTRIHWIDQYLARESRTYAHISKQCGEILDWPRDRFVAALERVGRERVEAWEVRCGLRIGTIPAYAFTPRASFPGIRLTDRFYRWVQDGAICSFKGNRYVPDTDVIQAAEAVVLFDQRQKPQCAKGQQMWLGDESFLGPIIARLRYDGRAGKSGEHNSRSDDPSVNVPAGSRFAIAPVQWATVIRPALQSAPLFGEVNWRLERWSDWYFLCHAHPELPRHRDDETDTWLFFEERVRENEQPLDDLRLQLVGGVSEDGGFASIYKSPCRATYNQTSFRPIGIVG